VDAIAKEPTGAIKRWSPPLTDDQRERFLELIGEGETRVEAARKVQAEADAVDEPCYSTATRWKGLIRRNEDFGSRYADALEVSGRPESPLQQRIVSLERLHLLDRMIDEFVERGLDPERGKSGSSNRVLRDLLTLMHDWFKPFLEARMHRHIHEGAVGVFAMPQLDTDKWTLEQHQEAVELRRRLNVLYELARPDGAPDPLMTSVALPPGAEVVDAEIVEMP